MICRDVDSDRRGALEIRVLRSVRRWLRGQMGFRVTGGMFVDWGGRLSRRLIPLITRLEDFYGPTWAETVEGEWRFVEGDEPRGTE